MAEATSPLRVDCFLLADAASAVEHKLFVLGGGWTTITASQLPATHRTLALAIRVVVPWHETNRTLAFQIDLVDEDGNHLLETPPSGQVTIGRPPNLRPGTEQAIPLAITFHDLVFAHAGAYVFRMTINGEPVARTTFQVVQREG